MTKNDEVIDMRVRYVEIQVPFASNPLFSKFLGKKYFQLSNLCGQRGTKFSRWASNIREPTPGFVPG